MLDNPTQYLRDVSYAETFPGRPPKGREGGAWFPDHDTPA